ncbi:Nucleoside-triphosphatase [Waddlia chondrophila 2032/99]|uniref:dITP/XTP pyrophosphatase n=2 Tax=Waddlia chondrophila TaxID=71667 RepID=D6YTJ5_WADCW|nr:XTP/dITP diphosphatase [Waddlia chondrophila]ADI37456.1 deoxyribonucleotide triphosphate pyrophosphatase [Waddlia chondrophila WSU 86-1044]CCB90773.1 Nucleoside-triphosphatase [Waddlia chondrophila 2032/99]
MELILATHNLHKIREFRQILKEVKGLDLISLRNFPDYQLPEETGKTFQENADLKALHAAKMLKAIVLADDSGLVVPALQGAPGIYSARYASSDATDKENREKLMQEMEKFEDLDRSAYYECCITIAGPEGILKTAKATCEGLIGEQEKGRNGFGYDPIFIKHDYDKTFAELEEQTKNRISHRRKALDKILAFLEAQIPSE